MVRSLVLCVAFAAVSIASEGAHAVGGPPMGGAAATVLQPAIFSTSFRSTAPDAVTSFRWIDAGKVFEMTIEEPAVRLVTKWTIQPGGSMSGTGSSGPQTGYISAAGFPVITGTSNGKPYESRFESTGNGYAVVVVQDQAPLGQPPQWTETRRTPLTAIGQSQASQLVAQWMHDRSAPSASNVALRTPVATDEAALRRHIAAIAAGQPLYQELTPPMADAVRKDSGKFQKAFADLGPVVFARFGGVDDKGVGLFKVEHAYAAANWKAVFDQEGRLAGFWYEPQQKRNEYREKVGKHSFGNPTVDDLPVNARVYAFLEPSDGKTTGSGWRTDCYRIHAPAGDKLKVSVWSGGQQTFARVVNGCDDWERKSYAENDITTADFGLRFAMPAEETFVVVHGQAPGRPYQVLLTELTPAEIAQWDEDIRQAQLAQQRIDAEKASQPSTFEAMVRGAAIGLSGIDAPLMPNEGNTLDILNQAGAALARQNEISRAQLNATIAQAQAQAQAQSQHQQSIIVENSAASPRPQAQSPSAATAATGLAQSSSGSVSTNCATRNSSQVIEADGDTLDSAQRQLSVLIANGSGADISGSESVVSMSAGAPTCAQKTVSDPMKPPPIGTCLACITEVQAEALGYIPGQGWPAPLSHWTCSAQANVVIKRCEINSSATRQ
jgi:hypothetical protein